MDTIERPARALLTEQEILEAEGKLRTKLSDEQRRELREMLALCVETYSVMHRFLGREGQAQTKEGLGALLYHAIGLIRAVAQTDIGAGTAIAAYFAGAAAASRGDREQIIGQLTSLGLVGAAREVDWALRTAEVGYTTALFNKLVALSAVVYAASSRALEERPPPRRGRFSGYFGDANTHAITGLLALVCDDLGIRARVYADAKGNYGGDFYHLARLVVFACKQSTGEPYGGDGAFGRWLRRRTDHRQTPVGRTLRP
jgi:hypothetical protein